MQTEQKKDIFTGECRVVFNRPAGRRYFLMELECSEIAETAGPGQFVMLKVSNGSEPFLPRPLAILDTDPKAGTFRLLYQVVGGGTRILSGKRSGSLRVIGPLGTPYRFVENAAVHVAVGGGTGIASVFSLVRGASAAGTRVVLMFGARDRDGLLPPDMLDIPGVEVLPSTDDGSVGFHGTAVDLLADFLNRETGASGAGSDDGISPSAAVYTAGPEPMMRGVADMAGSKGLKCFVSLESRMACGLGVCRGCVFKAKTPHPKTGLMTRSVCGDGPVFDAAEIDWEGFNHG